MRRSLQSCSASVQPAFTRCVFSNEQYRAMELCVCLHPAKLRVTVPSVRDKIICMVSHVQLYNEGVRDGSVVKMLSCALHDAQQ